jgi:hypothetical protein
MTSLAYKCLHHSDLSLRMYQLSQACLVVSRFPSTFNKWFLYVTLSVPPASDDTKYRNCSRLACSWTRVERNVRRWCLWIVMEVMRSWRCLRRYHIILLLTKFLHSRIHNPYALPDICTIGCPQLRLPQSPDRPSLKM